MIGMTVLIAYGSVEGRTTKIARFAEAIASEAGRDATVVDTSEHAGTLPWENID